MSNALPSRRALRASLNQESAAAETTLAAAEVVQPAPVQPAPVLSRKQLREIERQRSEAIGGVTQVAEDEYIPVSTGSIGLEPEAKSIVVTAVPDITNMSIKISETGEQLQTGSITIPPAAVPGVTLQTGSIALPVMSSATGEITLVNIGDTADALILGERTEGVVSGISPIPARKHLRARRSNKVFPTKLKKGKGQLYFALFSIIFMVGTAGVFVALLLLDLI